MSRGAAISRAVPNIRTDRPAETRDFFVDLFGFEVAMDPGWAMTVASPNDPSVQITSSSRHACFGGAASVQPS
jgi:hypothetical protein